MRTLEHSVPGPWWNLSPHRFLRPVLILAVTMALGMIALTNWLGSEWDNAPSVRNGDILEVYQTA